MKKIRSYLLFTSIPFRIGVMILFPLLLYGITYLFEEPVLGNIVKISFFAVVEVFFDFGSLAESVLRILMEWNI